jgi:hypothetical protein
LTGTIRGLGSRPAGPRVTRLDHVIGGVPLEDLMGQDFAWQEGWPYRLG